MNENVGAFLTRDKAVTLLSVEPLHGACRHGGNSLLSAFT
jgi:hypothetical protein